MAEAASYVQARDILLTAQMGVTNWYARWGEKYRGLYSYWKTEDCAFGADTDLSIVSAADLRKEINAWKEKYLLMARTLFSAYARSSGNAKVRQELSLINSCAAGSSAEQISSLCKIMLDERNSIRTAASSVYNQFADEYWEFLSGSDAAWAAADELFEWLDLFETYKDRSESILQNYYDATAGSLEYVNEIQNEKIKISSLVGYWEKRLELAEAVRDYAENRFSNLESNEQTEQNLSAALENYNQKKNEYQKWLLMLEEKRAEVAAAGENYSDAVNAAEEAAALIESEKAVYDELYDQVQLMENDGFLGRIVSMIAELERMELDEAHFCDELLKHCAFIQQKASENLLAEVEKIKSDFREGGGAEYDASLFEGISLGDELSDVKAQLDSAASGGVRGGLLPTAGIEEIYDKIDGIFGRPYFDVAEIETMAEELRAVDAADYSELESALAAFKRERTEANLIQVQEWLLKIGAFCKEELLRREAILVLLDGSAEEIHAYFEENKCERNDEILATYEKYSAALLNEKNELSRMKITSGLALSDSDFLNPAFAEIWRLYENALLLSEHDFEEEKIGEKISAVFETGIVTIGEHNFNLNVFEDFFENECPAALTYSFEQPPLEDSDYDFDGVCRERQKILDKILEECVLAEEPMKNLIAMNSMLKEQSEKIQSAQDSYEEKIRLLRGKDESSALNQYLKVCGQYNNFLLLVDNAYENLEAARNQYRTAEEIYFYAENEYLHGNYDARAKVEEARLKLENARTALEVLNALGDGKTAPQEKNSEYLEKNSEYKESYVRYYKARVLLYEYEQEVAEQKERLLAAERNEQKALSCLVTEFYGLDSVEDFSLPPYAEGLVGVSLDGDGNYRIELKKDSAGSDYANENSVVKEFFTDKCLEYVGIDGSVYRSSRAKAAALDFLCGMQGKPYSLEELALAALSLKLRESGAEKDGWLHSDENPELDSNYSLSSIPSEIHGAAVWASYKNGRLSVMEAAARKVSALDKDNDLAKYILFSETNLTFFLNLYSREHDYLSFEALSQPIDAVSSKERTYSITAAAFFAVAATYFAIACLPLGLGAWASGLAIAASLAGVTFMSMADKLGEVKKDLVGIRNGIYANLEKARNDSARYFEIWAAAVADRKEQRERLNVLLCGKKEAAADGEITWEDFDASMNCTFESGNTQVRYSFFGNMRPLFEELSSERKFTSVGELIEQMNFTLNDDFMKKEESLSNYLAEKSIEKNLNTVSFYEELNSSILEGRAVDGALLEEAAAAAWGKNSVNRSASSLDLLNFYNKEILMEFPVRLGSTVEKYTEDTMQKIRDEYAAAVLLGQQSQMDLKLFHFDMLESDMNEQISLWNDKIQSAKEIGKREWSTAEEKVSADYNAWQQEWILEYKDRNSIWQENYADFLSEKEDWIYGQYSEPGKNISAFKSADDIENYISDICAESALERTLSFFRSINSPAINEGISVKSAFLEAFDASALLDYDAALKKKDALNRDMQRAAAEYSAQNFQRQLECDIQDYFDAIGERNRGMEDWELNMVRAAGYSVDSEIHRDAIVDSTVFRTIRERQTVHRYEYFRPSAPDTGIDLASYSGSSAHLIMSRVEKIQQKIQEWCLSVFGKKSDSGRDILEGALQKHIGKSPTFIENINVEKSREENVREFGSGQLGLIMLDFQWNSIKNSAGYEELSKAIYDQKLIDADLGWFKLPTIREFVGIAMSVIEKVTGYVGISLLDDLYFGAFDLAIGYKSPADVAESLGKASLSLAATCGMQSLATKAAGFIADKAGMTVLGQGTQFIKASASAAGSIAGGAASSYINAIDFSRMTLDWDAAASFWADSSVWTSAAGSMLAGALGEFNNVDAGGLALSKNLFGKISSMNSSIGNLSAAAMNYLLSGDISFNVLSIPGMGGSSAGFFEFGLHDGEWSAGFGTDGLDVSPLAVMDFAAGVKTVKKVNALKNSAAEVRIALDASNLLAYAGGNENTRLAEALFNQERVLSFEDGGVGQLGVRSEGNAFVLDGALLSYSNEDRAKITSLVAMQNALELDRAFAEKESADGKKRSDFVMARMQDLAAATAVSRFILGLKTDEKSNDAIDILTHLYEQGGFLGVYNFYAENLAEAKKEAQKIAEEIIGKVEEDIAETMEEAREESKKEPQKITISFENVLEKQWSQNAAENREKLLGESLSMKEYNALARENAINRAVEKQRQKIIDTFKKNGETVNPTYLETALSNYRRGLEKTIVEGKKNAKYGYYPQTYSTDIKNFGCTLATAAYIAYSITGEAMTLEEANRILTENDLFEYGKVDENGISQKNELTNGNCYVSAVNKLAGGNYLETDSEKYSVSGAQNIFNRLIESKNNSSEVYFTHMRVNNGGHSVLFKSMEYDANTKAADVKINVIDPWSTSRFTPKTLGGVNRADFYKLTQAGKDIYNLVNSKNA